MINMGLITLIRVTRTKTLLLDVARQLLNDQNEVDREKLAARLLVQCTELNFVEKELDDFIYRETTVPLNIEVAQGGDEIE